MTRPRRVMITGAGRGIGLALTEACLANGDEVLATVRAGRREGLAEIENPRLFVLEMDVSDTASVRDARARCPLPSLDVIVENAGRSGGPQRAPGMDLARAEEILQVNALGALRVYDAFVDLLRLGNSPRALVNVSSEAGSLSAFRASGKPEYAMSKAALNALTRWVAAKDPEVLAVSLDPGWTQTDTGGAGATQTARQAAEKILSVLARLDDAHRGQFLTTDLTPIPW